MVLEIPENPDGDNVLSLVSGEPERRITVRNWGTAPLRINDEPGSQLGSGGSPAILLSRPDQIATHDVDNLAVRCGEVSFRDDFEHVFDSNDSMAAHNTLRFQTFPAAGAGGILPPDTETFCRQCGRCPEYLPPPPPATAGGPCQFSRCGHPGAVHFEVPPDHRNK
jgi:hypothetical protein